MGLKELFGGREDFMRVEVMYTDEGKAADIVLRLDGTYFKSSDPTIAGAYGEWPLGSPEDMAEAWARWVNEALAADGLDQMTGK